MSNALAMDTRQTDSQATDRQAGTQTDRHVKTGKQTQTADRQMYG